MTLWLYSDQARHLAAISRVKDVVYLVLHPATMYPSPQEKAVIDAAEKLMVETMARYDPSHDRYHGEYLSFSVS